jgi:hypothetical protein
VTSFDVTSIDVTNLPPRGIDRMSVIRDINTDTATMAAMTQQGDG